MPARCLTATDSCRYLWMLHMATLAHLCGPSSIVRVLLYGLLLSLLLGLMIGPSETFLFLCPLTNGAIRPQPLITDGIDKIVSDYTARYGNFPRPFDDNAVQPSARQEETRNPTAAKSQTKYNCGVFRSLGGFYYFYALNMSNVHNVKNL